MIGVERYISNIKEKAIEHLRSEYNINIFSQTDFELINFFLLDQAINKDQNVFIKTLDNEQESEIYLPTIVSVAISLFFKNYCDDKTNYKEGDILQKDGIRYEYVKKNSDGTHCIRSSSGLFPEVRNLKKYIVTNANLSNRKVRTRFDDYKKLFQAIFNTNYFPSVFSKKAVIIIEKKDFLNELKTQSFSSEINLSKAIPYQWVNKNGKFEMTPIPIEPMIYLVPDYETFKEYIFDSDIDIDAVIAIGKNKYQPEVFRRMKRELREEEIPFAIVIGNEEIEDEYGLFKKWNWTAPEVALLQDIDEATISTIQVPKDEFQNKIETFDKFISDTEREYDIKLPIFNGFKKLLYSLVLPCADSRLKNQIDYLQYAINKIYSEEIDASLFNQNIDSKDRILQLETITEELLSSFSNDKLTLLKEYDFDFLVAPKIPKDAPQIWNDESNIRTLSYEEFLSKLNNAATQKTFLFLSPFGYIPPHDLYKFIKTTFHKYVFLTYDEEERVILNYERRYENHLGVELNSDDRTTLTGIAFPYEEQPENVSDLIDRIHDKQNGQGSTYFFEDASTVNYQIDFEGHESLVLAANKSVLLEKNSQKSRIKVSNLIPGDKIRIYSNPSKDLLFETAKKQDLNSRFSEIEEHSRFWKECLYDYFVRNGFDYSEEKLLKEMQSNGVSIKSTFTLKNWLNPESSVKFPHKQRDLLAINRTIKNKALEDKISEVSKSRSIYNGIMIALGRDLSDEVMEFIMNRNKGKILSSFSESEIQSFVNISAPLRRINKIQITEEDESE